MPGLVWHYLRLRELAGYDVKQIQRSSAPSGYHNRMHTTDDRLTALIRQLMKECLPVVAAR